MPSEAMSEAIIRFGFPLFWVALGVIQWFWPAAIFTGFSNDAVTPGARGFAVFWLCVGATLAYLFVPQLDPFSGLFVPGFVLVVVGILQSVRPVLSSPLPARLTDKAVGSIITACGLAVLGLNLV